MCRQTPGHRPTARFSTAQHSAAHEDQPVAELVAWTAEKAATEPTNVLHCLRGSFKIVHDGPPYSYHVAITEYGTIRVLPIHMPIRVRYVSYLLRLLRNPRCSNDLQTSKRHRMLAGARSGGWGATVTANPQAARPYDTVQRLPGAGCFAGHRETEGVSEKGEGGVGTCYITGRRGQH